MVGLEREIPARLLEPMCPRCGDGRVLRADGSPRLRCCRCRHDLYTHRPRSYAEMEGLVEGAEWRVLSPSSQRGWLHRLTSGLGLIAVKLGMR